MKPDKINKLIKRLAAVSLWLIIWQIASGMTGLELLLASPVTVLRTLAGTESGKDLGKTESNI